MAVNPSTAGPARRWRLPVLLGPAVFWLTLFFGLPFLVIVVCSFLSRGPTGAVEWEFTFDNYITLFSEPIYTIVFWRSVWLGVLTTLICLLVGYPLALSIVRQPLRWRTLLIFLILLPFWTNFLVRTYAWMTLLNNNGLLNNLIVALGGQRLTLIGTEAAVLIGLIYGHLPFMVLPIYAALDRFDFSLLEAAHDLGANSWWAFLRVMLPLTMPGIAAGSVLVFIPSAGNYIVPALLGGGKVDLIGNQLERLFGPAQNWPLGSAMALLLMLLLTAGVVVYFRVTTEEDR